MNIEFKPFEFITWEEFQENSAIFKTISARFIFGEVKIKKRKNCMPAYDDYISANFLGLIVNFEYSKEGYDKACEWINELKYNLAKQLSR